MSKKIFPKPLKGKYVGNGQWKLIASFEYRNPPIFIKVPIGFITDGASIPTFAMPLIGSPWSGKYAKAAVLHDYLYVIQITSRWEADRIFYQAMKILKVSLLKRTIMHTTVRLIGWMRWKEFRRK